MNAEQLQEAEAAYRAALAHSEQAREERNRLVLAALDAGWTHQRIAELTGLSRGRVSQFAALQARS